MSQVETPYFIGYINKLKNYKMDFISSIIGIGFLSILIVPLVWAHFSQKKKDTLFYDQYTKVAHEHGITVGTRELWNHNQCIGLDEHAHQLFYFRQLENDAEYKQINLAEFIKCDVVIQHKIFFVDNKESQIINQVDLVFRPLRSKQPEVKIAFYNGDESLQLNNELLLANKWSSLVNDHIHANTPKVTYNYSLA
jgi:hypothetical protein